MCRYLKDSQSMFIVAAATWMLAAGTLSATGAQEGFDGVRGQAVSLGPVLFSELPSPPAGDSLTGGDSRSPRPRGKLQSKRSKLKVPDKMTVPSEPPASARTRSGPTEESGLSALTSSATGGPPSPAPSASFEALLDNATTFNPDTSGAVGPNHVMTTLSSELRIQNRGGVIIGTASLDSFWATLGDPEVFDPRVLYDPFQQRWIHVATANFNVNPGLLVAVSTTSDPTAVWERYFIDIDTALPVFAESPNVGFNKNWIAVQANMFDQSTLEFTVSEIFTFSKANLYAGGSGAFTRFTLADGSFGEESFGGPVNAQVPAVTMDNTEETLFLLSHWIGDADEGEFDNFGFLRVFRISGSLNSPTFAPGEFATTLTPIPWAPFDLFNFNTLPQLGTTDKISAGDCRLQNVVFRGGSLWTAQTVFLPADNPTRASVQWWELIPTDVNDLATIFQFGRVDDASGATMFAYPSIFPNKDFDVLVGFSRFSSTTYPSAAYAFKTDAQVSEFRPPHVYKQGQHSFSVFDGNINRWGDWSATMVDPLNDVDFWTLQEYASSQVSGEDRWGTWWGRVSPPVDLVVTMNDSPDPIVAGGNITYTLTVTNKQNSSQLASGIKLTDVLPAGLSYVSATASQGACSHNAGTINCDFGTLAASNLITATLVLRTTASGQLAHTVTVTANGPDVNPADNTVTATTTVNPSADLSVMASGSPNPVHQGQPITYSISVRNAGPSAAANSRLTNTLPAGVSYVSATPSQGNCSRSGQVVECNFGTLGALGTATVTIVALAGSGGIVNNLARVGSSSGDANTANNTVNVSLRVNALPVLGALSDLTIDEDTSTAPLAFTVSDAETPAANLSLTITSSNPALVPPENLILSGTGSSRTLTITPLPNRSGSTVITRTVTDNDGASVSSQFTLTVRAINDPPTITQLAAQQTDEDTTLGPLSFVIGDVEKPAETLSLTRSSSSTVLIPTTSIVLGGSGANRTVTITPASNRSGSATVTITVGDGTTSTSMAFLVTVRAVNDPPTISSISDKSISEDVTSTSYGFTVTDVESSNGSLVLSALSSNPSLIPPANVSFGGTGSSRNFRVTSAPNQFGQCTVTIVVTDLDGGTNQSAFLVTVNPVNDNPTLAPIADVAVDEDAGVVMVPLSGIAPGPANELESVTLSASSSQTSVIPHPTIQYSGTGAQATLLFEPVPDANGSATVTVTVDDGQSSNNRTTQSFTINVSPVNDPPAVTSIADQIIDEDTSTDALSFTMQDLESTDSRLSFSGRADDPVLVPESGIQFSGTGSTRRMTVTPAPDRFGATFINLLVSDGEATTTNRFRLTVNPVNDPPTLSAFNNASTAEDTPLSGIALTVGDVETAPGALTVAATSSNPTLIPNANLTVAGTTAARTLSLLPAPNQSGTAIISVTVTDEGGLTDMETFVVDVTAVNDPPTLNSLPNVTRAEDSGAFTVGLSGITSGAADEMQSLSVSATSGNPALIPPPTVNYSSPGTTGILTLRPATNAHGTVTITVTVNDGSAADATFSRSFNVIITPVNDPPFLSPIPAQSTDEDTPTPDIALTVFDVETPAGNLVLSAFSSNEELVFSDDIVLGGTGGDRTIRIHPLPEQFGTASIFLLLSDGDGGMVNHSFELTVRPVNDAPVLSAVPDQTAYENHALGPIGFTVSDLETPPRNLIVTARSSDQTLLPDTGLTLGGTDADRTLRVAPASDRTGSATVTLSLSDGDDTVTHAFTVDVLERPALDIEISGASVILRWPESAADFVLESRGLFDMGSWSPVAQTPVSGGGFRRVTLPRSETSRYFQLRRP